MTGRPVEAAGVDWRTVVLTKQSPLPLYYQLAEQIREFTRAGRLAAGAQLPAEHDLADQVGISRMTARQAIAYLVRDGTLAVRHGVGTFVAEPKLTYDALHLLGFTEETMRRGDVVASRVLEQVVVRPPPAVAAALALPPGEPTIKIVRLRLAARTPLLLETTFLPMALCQGLEDEDLERQSLYSLLELRYGLRLAESHQFVEAAVANRFESELLGIAPGAPMLVVEGVTTVADSGQPVEAFKAIYRADRIKFALASRREAGSARDPAPSVSLLLV